MNAPLSAAEAARRILDDVRRQPALRVPLDDALDSVLAEDIVSPIDIPAWTNSAMDGYAARGDDVRGASAEEPVRLRVVEVLPAGAFPTRRIEAGETARIFTGAPLPDGADTVVRQEDTDEGAETVTIVRDRDVGVNFRRVGEDIRRGATVLTAGMALGPAPLGVLASLAVAQPLVYRRPRVAILGSGDEIVDVDQPEEILSGRKIASSNTHTLVALVRQAGGEPVNLGIARDTPESLREHFRRALDCDLLVTTAGISVGEHDYVRSVLDELGAVQRFWKLRMRPGAPVGLRAARRDSVDRPAGQPGQHDGDVRAVRAAGHPKDVRASPALPPRGARAAGRAGLGQAEAAAFPAGDRGRNARRAGGQAHGAAGLGHSHLDGARERPARPSGGSVRYACRCNGAGDQARRSGAPARARVLIERSDPPDAASPFLSSLPASRLCISRCLG